MWRRSQRDGIGDYAASLSYRMLLAMFPFAIFLAAAGSATAWLLRLDNPTYLVLQRIGNIVPLSTRPIIEEQLNSVLRTDPTGLLSIGIVGAIWAASGGVAAAMRAMNRAYEVDEDRPWWKQMATSIGLTLASAAMFIVLFAMLFGGSALAWRIAQATGIGEAAWLPLRVAGALLVLVMLLAATAVLYWTAPAGKRACRWVSPGALLFVIGWLVVSFAFAQYVSRFGRYEATYGTLGGVVVLMLWMYLSAYLLLLGAEVNAVIGHAVEHTEPQPVRHGYSPSQ